MITANFSSILYGENSKEPSHISTIVRKPFEHPMKATWNGQVNQDAAWTYSDPSNLAEGLKDHVAFWRGVEVSK